MKAWLQSADLSSVDLDLHVEGAIRALHGHDWAAEAARRAALERAGEEWCEAGLGLVRDDGHILHICPSGATATVYHHARVRVLGGLWRRNRRVTRPSFPLAGVADLIRAFYTGNDALLATRLA
jgi:hypothetical protein